MTQQTVKFHLTNIYRKLGAKNRTQATGSPSSTGSSTARCSATTNRVGPAKGRGRRAKDLTEGAVDNSGSRGCSFHEARVTEQDDGGRSSRLRPPAHAAGRIALASLCVLGLVAIGVAIWSLVHGGSGGIRARHKGDAPGRSVDSSWTLERAYASVVGTSEFYGSSCAVRRPLHRVATGSTTLLQPDDPATYTYQGSPT